MRRLIRPSLLVLLLGILTTIIVAFALAAFTPIPTVPRTTTGAFVRWDRPWHAVEAHRFGLVHIWWSDLHQDEALRNAIEIIDAISPRAAACAQHLGLGKLKPAAAEAVEAATAGTLALFVKPRPAAEVVEAYRVRAADNQLHRRTRWPLALKNSSRPWGTFAASEPPSLAYTMGSDACFGWPIPCLWYQIFTTFNPLTMSTVSDELRGGFILYGSPESRGDRYRAFPLRPSYAGFAINTALYSLLWALLLFGPSTIRRTLRLRRGHCPRCGYDVQHTYSSPCPECGHTAPIAPPRR